MTRTGDRQHNAPACYRRFIDASHRHMGPFQRCTKCRRVICPECIGTHVGPGKAFCIECAQTVYNKPRHGRPWSTRPSALRRAARSVSGATGQAFAVLWAASRWLVGTLARPFHSDPDAERTVSVGADITLTYGSLDTLLKLALYAVLAIAVVAGLALVYGDAYGIPPVRVIVAVVASLVMWGILAIELRYLFRHLGRLPAQVFAFATALLLALLFGAWLINQNALDGLLGIF